MKKKLLITFSIAIIGLLSFTNINFSKENESISLNLQELLKSNEAQAEWSYADYTWYCDYSKGYTICYDWGWASCLYTC